MYCTNCGLKICINDFYCTNCGNKIVESIRLLMQFNDSIVSENSETGCNISDLSLSDDSEINPTTLLNLASLVEKNALRESTHTLQDIQKNQTTGNHQLSQSELRYLELHQKHKEGERRIIDESWRESEYDGIFQKADTLIVCGWNSNIENEISEIFMTECFQRPCIGKVKYQMSIERYRDTDYFGIENTYETAIILEEIDDYLENPYSYQRN